MKTIVSFSVLFLLTALFAEAQKPIRVDDNNIKFGESTMPAFSLVIPEADFESTVKNWTKELQSGTKSKVVEKGDELSIFGARIKKISDNPLNVYSKIDQEGDGVKMDVAFETERDKFVENAQRDEAKNYLFNFAKDQYVSIASQQLDNEKKKLKDLQKDLSELERDQEKMEKESKSNKVAVAEEKERLNILNKDVETITDSTRNMNNSEAMGATDPDLRKDMEKDRRRADRDIRSSEKKIIKAQDEISANESALPRNVEQQKQVRRQVAEQEEVVKQYEEKLTSIKEMRLE